MVQRQSVLSSSESTGKLGLVERKEKFYCNFNILCLLQRFI